MFNFQSLKSIICLSSLLVSLHAVAETPQDVVAQFMRSVKEDTASNELHLVSFDFRKRNKVTDSTKFNGYTVTDFKILGVFGDYVDVEIFNTKCTSCSAEGQHILRFKLVKEEGQYKLLPHTGYIKGGYLDPWWQDIKGAYEPLGKESSQSK